MDFFTTMTKARPKQRNIFSQLRVAAGLERSWPWGLTFTFLSFLTHMFEFKQHLPVQLDSFPVDVFDGDDVSLKTETVVSPTSDWRLIRLENDLKLFFVLFSFNCSKLIHFLYKASWNLKWPRHQNKSAVKTHLVITCFGKNLHIPLCRHQGAIVWATLKTRTNAVRQQI